MATKLQKQLEQDLMNHYSDSDLACLARYHDIQENLSRHTLIKQIAVANIAIVKRGHLTSGKKRGQHELSFAEFHVGLKEFIDKYAQIVYTEPEEIVLYHHNKLFQYAIDNWQHFQHPSIRPMVIQLNLLARHSLLDIPEKADLPPELSSTLAAEIVKARRLNKLWLGKYNRKIRTARLPVP